ncbi:ATP-binding protein [Thiolapillus sp.]
MHHSLSLARRLLLILAAAMLVALVVTVYSLLEYVDKEAEEVLDARLTLTAENLLRQARRYVREGNLNEVWLTLETVRGLENAWLEKFANADRLMFGEDDHDRKTDEVRSYIWLTSGDEQVVVGEVLPGYDAHHPLSQGLRTVHHDGAEWRVAEVHEDGFHLHVAQRDDLRAYLVREIGWKLMEKQLIAIPVIIFVLWLGIRRGLKPLSRLSDQVASRKPDNLQPVRLEQVPGEIVPLIKSINELLDRLRVTLEGERSFTADAAHELRSPLAVVRNVARIMSRAGNLAEVHQASDLLDKSAVRMADLLSQLLHLSRLDSLVHAEASGSVSLRELMREVVGELLPLASEKGMRVAYLSEDEITVVGDNELLRLMFRNLIGNAVKYGREEVEIRTRIREGVLFVEILDDGPGVAEAELPHLFARFFRSQLAKQKVEGSGLGLSIVRRVAELHGFDASAANRAAGGLVVSVKIPRQSWQHIHDEDESARAAMPD